MSRRVKIKNQMSEWALKKPKGFMPDILHIKNEKTLNAVIKTIKLSNGEEGKEDVERRVIAIIDRDSKLSSDEIVKLIAKKKDFWINLYFSEYGVRSLAEKLSVVSRDIYENKEVTIVDMENTTTVRDAIAITQKRAGV